MTLYRLTGFVNQDQRSLDGKDPTVITMTGTCLGSGLVALIFVWVNIYYPAGRFSSYNTAVPTRLRLAYFKHSSPKLHTFKRYNPVLKLQDSASSAEAANQYMRWQIIHTRWVYASRERRRVHTMTGSAELLIQPALSTPTSPQLVVKSGSAT
jgi:hypothetical protein